MTSKVEIHNSFGEKMLMELRKLQQFTIYIGVPRDNGFLTMIALVNETGKNIHAKRGKYLWIPTKNAKGRKPREIDGLFKPKGKNVMAVQDKSAKNGFKIMFILKEEVNIPARPFMRYCYSKNRQKWGKATRDLIYLMIKRRDINAEEILNRLGSEITRDLKKTIQDFSYPRNAPLTINNKGFNNPLIKDKELMKSITYAIERK